MSGLLDELSGLMIDINSGNVYIVNKFDDLNGLINSLGESGSLTGVNAILEDIDDFVEREHSNLSGFYNLLQ
jgi:hypothetical protein